MKVSDLIKKLQEIKEQDSEIIINNLSNECLEFGYIQDLELINNGSGDEDIFITLVGVEFESTKIKGEKENEKNNRHYK